MVSSRPRRSERFNKPLAMTSAWLRMAWQAQPDDLGGVVHVDHCLVIVHVDRGDILDCHGCN